MMDKMSAATSAAILSRDYEETTTELTNNSKSSTSTTGSLRLRIAILVCAAFLLMLNNALYILFIPLVIEQYAVVSNNDFLYYYGGLYASKDIALLIMSPVVGGLIDRVGCVDPLISGIGFILISTIIFAFGESYWLFFTNRTFQGLNSAFTDTSIMVLIAILFPDDAARTNAFGALLGCSALGFLLASPFVTIVTKHLLESRIYFLGFDIAYLILGLIIFFLMKKYNCRQDLNVRRRKHDDIAWKILLDPYVLISAGSLAMSQIVLSFLQYVLPFWLGGYVALVSSVRMTCFLGLFSHISGILVALLLIKKDPHHRWLIVACGLVLQGFCGLILPFVSSYVFLLIPTCGITFSVALVRIVILPTLARLADSRHTSIYGSTFAISYVFYAIVDIIAPVTLYNLIPHTMLTVTFVGVALSSILYAPTLLFLRRIY
ncbi:membrane transporter [Oryctes borbonicus]|uniref:Membrane transporter n=1 Tax=Oryctes borbonicus TaxID=1629725 RepID=A0A0T6B120_9SCAR|nr:membrane transporter [Oryctes borbonicus]